MSTTNDNKRQQLISKLSEMFQMDQADLDFGIYRIMNAKRDEISQFLEQDLLPTLPTLRTALQESQPAGLADKQRELADAIANAKKRKIDDRLWCRPALGFQSFPEFLSVFGLKSLQVHHCVLYK